MALSDKAKEAIRRAVTEDKVAAEISAAIDSNGSGPAADPADIGATTDLPASNATLSTSDTYSDAAVKLAIDDAIDAVSASVEARLDAIEAKVDALLDALRAAGMIA